MTASTGKQSTLRVAVHKGRYIRKTRAASGWVIALPLFAMALAGCNGPGHATVEIRAEPAIIAPGETVRLSWRSAQVTGCQGSGSWSGPHASSGSQTVIPPPSGGLYRLDCIAPAGSVAAQIRVTVLENPAVVFPLRAVPGQHYLSDATGRPLLVQGDAGWSLIAATRRDEAERYLDDRRARGFDALIVSLVEHKFAIEPPKNAYGVAPFKTAGDFSTPNDEYFDYANWVLDAAEQRHMAVFLAPAYLGYLGADEGWYHELTGNSSAQLRAYGRYVGERLRAHRNIVWLFGGDYNPPIRRVVSEIAAGVAESGATQLATVHCATESGASQVWGDEPWLTLNTAYTYRSVSAMMNSLLRSSPLPLVLIETRYEGEPGITAWRARLQAYQAVLAGAGGQFFGNRDVWHFAGPGNFPTLLHWQQALPSEGASSMMELGRLMRSQRWWLLHADGEHQLLQRGTGMGLERAAAAVARDGSFALLYLPTPRRVRLRLDELAGPTVEAHWFDPVSGAMSSRLAFARSRDSTVDVPLQPRNGGGAGDWVLVLTSR